MANLKENEKWEPGIYQLETTDPVMGGEDGIDNLQAKQLANRTSYLKKQIENVSNLIPTVPVKSVNGKTGDIQLSAADVGTLTEQQLGERFLPAKLTPGDQPIYEVGERVDFKHRLTVNNSELILKNDYSYEITENVTILRRADGLIVQHFTATYRARDGANGTIISIPVAFNENFYFAISSDGAGGCHTVTTVPLSLTSARIFGAVGERYVDSYLQIVAVGR